LTFDEADVWFVANPLPFFSASFQRMEGSFFFFFSSFLPDVFPPTIFFAAKAFFAPFLAECHTYPLPFHKFGSRANS